MRYLYLERKCPYCNHEFVVLFEGTKYKIHGNKYIKTKCPECDVKLFISKKEKYGRVADFISEDEIKITELTLR